MGALRAFWAKSLLNKGVILGLIFVVCCCPVGLAGRGRRSGTIAAAPTAAPAQVAAEAAPTDAPSATAGPTKTPLPTETPAPTAEPTEAAAPAGGLGVSRAALQDLYEQAGLSFEVSPLQDGRARAIGTSADKSLIELIGPAEELTSASAIVGFTAAGEEQRTVSALYITGLIAKVAPEHLQEISEWLGERLRTQQDGELVTGPYRSSAIFLTANDGVLVTYTIKAAE